MFEPNEQSEAGRSYDFFRAKMNKGDVNVNFSARGVLLFLSGLCFLLVFSGSCFGRVFLLLSMDQAQDIAVTIKSPFGRL